MVRPILGDVPMSAFTLGKADAAMSTLPSHLAPASRRKAAQMIHRVCKLAVYPLRLIPVSPIPQGWMPRIPKGSQKKQEMPTALEADRFVASDAVPVVVRLFCGFVAREGMRHSEAEGLTWADLDRDHGLVRLDVNKTDDPRSWALRPGTARALRRWYELQGEPAVSAFVFTRTDGERFRIEPWRYREHLLAAGLDRTALHEGTKATAPTAIHALRALFVTEALSRGESEGWVADRTGHRSSQMIATYKRRARAFQEARMPTLGPLDVVLGWASVDVSPDGPGEGAQSATGPSQSATEGRGRPKPGSKTSKKAGFARGRSRRGLLLIRRSGVRAPVDPPFETRGFVNEARESRDFGGTSRTLGRSA
jgi:integrase